MISAATTGQWQRDDAAGPMVIEKGAALGALLPNMAHTPHSRRSKSPSAIGVDLPCVRWRQTGRS